MLFVNLQFREITFSVFLEEKLFLKNGLSIEILFHQEKSLFKKPNKKREKKLFPRLREVKLNLCLIQPTVVDKMRRQEGD